MNAILNLYKSLVRSIIEYASPEWTPKYKSHYKIIERVQAMFVRYLFHKFNGFYPKYPNYIEYSLLIENLDIVSVQKRIEQNQIKHFEWKN